MKFHALQGTFLNSREMILFLLSEWTIPGTPQRKQVLSFSLPMHFRARVAKVGSESSLVVTRSKHYVLCKAMDP